MKCDPGPGPTRRSNHHTPVVFDSEAAGCSLPPGALGNRVDEWRSLTAQALHREIAAGRVLRTYPNGPDIARRFAELGRRGEGVLSRLLRPGTGTLGPPWVCPCQGARCSRIILRRLRSARFVDDPSGFERANYMRTLTTYSSPYLA
jgi:hypothetical protein